MTQDFATKYTGMAFVLATLFKVQFEGVTITGRTPKISEPHSPSSEGGELVLQRISLEHEGWPVIIIGSANCATNAVELRSWSYLEQAHRKRYPNKRFPLVKTDYADFFVQLADFFRDRDMEVTILNAEPEKRARAKAAAKAPAEAAVGPVKPSQAHPRRLAILIALLAVTCVGAVVAWILLDWPAPWREWPG